MKLTINGETVTIEPISVHDYLQALEIDPRTVAVELNREILPKSAYRDTVLSEGDTVEIVHFVGGGQGSLPPLLIPSIRWQQPGLRPGKTRSKS